MNVTRPTGQPVPVKTAWGWRSSWYDPAARDQRFHHPTVPAPRKHGDGISERRLQCLELRAQGMSMSEVGRALHVTEDTVKTHLTKLYQELGVHNACGAIAVAFREGWLQ